MPHNVTALIDQLQGAGYGEPLKAIVESGVIEQGRLSVLLSRRTLAEHLGLAEKEIRTNALRITAPFRLQRRGVEAKLVLGDSSDQLDRTLVKAVAKGLSWFEEMKARTSMQVIAQREGISQRRVAHLIDLAFLAPDMVTAIIDGKQPTSLTAERLVKADNRPLWADQRAYFLAN